MMAETTISKVKDSSLSSGKDEDPNSAGTIHLVFQRYRSCRILLNEQEWISVGDNNTRSHQDQRSEPQLAPPPQPPPPLPVPPDSHPHHCGLLVYVSFATGATKASVQAVAHTILHLPLLTTGLWGDGTSEQKSVMDFVTMRQQQQQQGGKEPHFPSSSLVLCPQANLIGKVRGRSGQIQYHGQISKEQGHVLFEHLASCLIGLLLERQCELLSASRLSSAAATTTTTTTTTSSSFPLPISYRQWKQELEREQQKLSWQEQQQNRNDTQPHASIAPQHLFRPQSSDDHNHDDSNIPAVPGGGGSSSSSYLYHASNYSAWNDDGLPTHDAKGEPMTKSALKKLKKLQEAHGKRHEKWLQKKKMGQPRQDNKDDNNHDNDRKDKITTTQEGSTKEKDHTIQLTSRSSSSNSNNKNDDDSPSPDNQQTVTTATTTTTALCPSWRQDLDPNFCSVIVGSFGKRQGLELCSDMVPFCHTFQV